MMRIWMMIALLLAMPAWGEIATAECHIDKLINSDQPCLSAHNPNRIAIQDVHLLYIDFADCYGLTEAKGERTAIYSDIGNYYAGTVCSGSKQPKTCADFEKQCGKRVFKDVPCKGLFMDGTFCVTYENATRTLSPQRHRVVP